MTVYYVDDGGSNTAPYDTWAKAAPDIRALDTAVAFAGGDIVYFGHDSVDSGVGASFTITLPTSGPPTYFISATQGSDPPTYQQATANQIVTTTGNYAITIDGSVALYGIKVFSAQNIHLNSDINENFSAYQCSFTVGPNDSLTNTSAQVWMMRDCTFDTQDAANSAFVAISAANCAEFYNLTLGANCAYRNATLFAYTSSPMRVYGGDFTTLTNGTLCEIIDAAGLSDPCIFSNIKTDATWALWSSGTMYRSGRVIGHNIGPAYAPTYYLEKTLLGELISSSSIYRTNGASFEGVNTSWLVVTSADCSEGGEFTSPWMVGSIDAAGSKTWSCYITNDSGDFTNAEVWLEILYLPTSGEPQIAIGSSHRTITATPTAVTDDTTSTWNGTGPSFTYKQVLSVTATVGQAGQYRARVCVGKASIASSAYFYIDPKVIVT